MTAKSPQETQMIPQGFPSDSQVVQNYLQVILSFLQVSQSVSKWDSGVPKLSQVIPQGALRDAQVVQSYPQVLQKVSQKVPKR